jgi:hypothetical protein
MRRLLIILGLVLMAALAASACGGGDDDRERVTEFPDGTLGTIGRLNPDGTIERPVIELWNIPACTCDELITNTPHGTRVRVLRQKPDCPGAPIEVEILEGEKAGIRGWIWPGRYVTLDETPTPSSSG